MRNVAYRLHGMLPSWIPKQNYEHSHWLCMNSDTSLETVDLILISMLAYNEHLLVEMQDGLKIICPLTNKEPILRSMISMMDKRLFVMAGGIAFSNRTSGYYATEPILPRCCGELENWHENVNDMVQYRCSPWMGHDPSVKMTC